MIYLDNAATSWPKPEVVYQAMDDFNRNTGASPGRSGHKLSIAAGRIIYEAREALSEVFGVNDPLRIIFTSNATEALNIAIKGIIRTGDHVVTTSMEHNSVMRPLQAVKGRGAEITIVNCSQEGFLEAKAVERAIRKNTRLIILNHASNVVGTLLPIADVGYIAHHYGILFLVDAAQTAGHIPLDVQRMNIDLLAFAGHKGLYGPQGTGGFYLREGVELILEPLKQGGTGSRSESEYQPDFLPDKYESGTPNTVGIAGLAAGTRFLLSQDIANVQEKERELTRIIIEELERIPDVIVYGSRDANKQVAVISFNISSLAPSEVVMRLDYDYDIMCRPGLHCAPFAHKTIGTFPQGTVRLSPGYFSSEEDLVGTIKAIRSIAQCQSK